MEPDLSALDRADPDRAARLDRRAPPPRRRCRSVGGPPLPADPPRRPRARPAGDADAEPLHAADLDRRSGSGSRRVRGPRPRQPGDAGAAQGRLAEPLDGRRVPQVRRLRGLEVPPPGEPLGNAERAADHGLAGLRLDPRRDRGEGAGDPLLHGGTAGDEHPRPRQRGRLRRDPRPRSARPGRDRPEHGRLASVRPRQPGRLRRREPRRSDPQPRLPRGRRQRLVRHERRRHRGPRRGPSAAPRQGRLHRRQPLLARARAVARVPGVERDPALRLRPARHLCRSRQSRRRALPDRLLGLRLGDRPVRAPARGRGGGLLRQADLRDRERDRRPRRRPAPRLHPRLPRVAEPGDRPRC